MVPIPRRTASAILATIVLASPAAFLLLAGTPAPILAAPAPEPEPGCGDCHGNSAGCWPDGAAAPDRAGRHPLHVARIAARLGYAPPFSDQQQRTMCAYCHENPNGVAFPLLHLNGAVQVTGYVDALWSTPGGAESQDPGAAYFTTGATDGCLGVDCHNNKTAMGTLGWYGASPGTCIMCHTPGGGANRIADPLGGLHRNAPGPKVTGVAHDDLFGSGAGCPTCHTVPAVAPGSGHMTDGTSPADTAGNGPGDFYLTLPGYRDEDGTCGGASVDTGCHDGAGERGSWRRRWSLTAYNGDGTECANCHGGFSDDWTFGTGAHDTTDGDVEHGYSWDGDGVGEVVGNHTGLTQQQACNLCHLYAGDVYPANAGGSIGWAGNPANSSSWHGNDSLEMNSHSTVAYNATSFSCAGGACHPSGGASRYHLEKSRWGLHFLPWVGACEERLDGPALTGPAEGKAGVRYAFLAQGAASSCGHPLEYEFDWGSGPSGLWGPSGQNFAWEAAQRYPLRVRARCQTHPGLVSSWSPTADLEILPCDSPCLGEAVDADGLVWGSDGDSPWLFTDEYSREGGDAARSGSIGADAFSRLWTVVNGPACLGFWWGVSSEENRDGLLLSLDDQPQDWLTGDVPWREEAVALGKGLHTLSWSYAKDASGEDALDRGWLDQVALDPALRAITLLKPGAAGLTWRRGRCYGVSWNWCGAVPRVNLAVLDCRTGRRTTLARRVKNQGTWRWCIPDRFPRGRYAFRVESSGRPSLGDEGFACFTVR
jgi:hypothetical protein